MNSGSKSVRVVAGALFVICSALRASGATSGLPADVGRPSLFELLHTSQHQWTMNHICLPSDVVTDASYTNADFSGAILEYARYRWDAALAAQKSGDTKRAMFIVGYISHTITDLHWPGRVERNAEGRIVRFKTCEELGGSDGVLSEEKLNPSNSMGEGSEAREKAISDNTAMFTLFKYGQDFDVLAALLRRDSLLFAPSQDSRSLQPLQSTPNGAAERRR